VASPNGNVPSRSDLLNEIARVHDLLVRIQALPYIPGRIRFSIYRCLDRLRNLLTLAGRTF